MTWTTTRALLDASVSTGSAVLAFNVITLEHAEGIVAGLERAGLPGILQVSENALLFHEGALGPLVTACREVARAADVPVSVHLDHVQDLDLCREGIASAELLGVSSIMVDASHLPFDENLARTTELTTAAHRVGLWVEAELGAIGGKGGAHTPGVRTDPDEASEFVATTGVDGLAVAVGSAHAMTSATATLDLELIERLAGAVPVPLVLHGSSGVPSAMIREAVLRGVRKINVGTALNVAYTDEVRRTLAADDHATDPRRYLRPAREAVATSVARLSGEVLSA